MKEFLARFTPSLMSHQTLETIFVQREKLAQSLVERVRDSVLTPSKHYALLIGPRGMGKTHLVALVYHRVKAMEDLQDPMCIAWLREEEWVTSYLDLLLRILRALNEEYNDADLAEQTEALYDLSVAEAERAAADLLVKYLDGRVLLVLIENLDEIFRGLKQEGQQQLRAFLQNHGNTMMLATAQSLFNGVSLRTSPFYGFFNVQHLQQLDINDATRLLIRIAELAPDPSLVAFMQTPKGRARVRAVHHLAGGNPRVYLIFAQFLNREALDDLVGPFMQMLDDLTPYYQSRMLHLSPQQRKIVEFLVENRGAAPVKRIAQRCFLTHQTATSQLKTLRDNGYVKSESVGRESFYQLREPLMRLVIEVKKQRDKPIRLILDFLRLWYTRSELEQRLELLQPEAVLEREYVFHALEISGEEAENPLVAACLKDLRKYFEEGDFERALQAAEELVEIRGSAGDWTNQGSALMNLGQYEEALSSYERVLALNPEYAKAWYSQGVTLGNLGRIEEALAAFEKALSLNPEDASAWSNQGVALERLGQYEEALSSYERALALNPEDALAWLGQGAALFGLGRYEEALSSYDRVLGLNPEYALAWSSRSGALVNLGRDDEALATSEKALSLNSEDASAWSNHGAALVNLGRYEEALSSYERALSLNSEDVSAWYSRGLALGNLGRNDDALVAFEKALTLNPEYALAWSNQGNALVNLDRPEEALLSYERALELNPEYALAWSNQGVALGRLGQYEEALASFEQAIALEDQAASFLGRAGALSFLGRWDAMLDAVGDALQRATEADLADVIRATDSLLRRLLTTQADQTWQDYVQKLVALYDRYEATSQLALGLAGSLNELKSETLKTDAWKAWLKCWEEAAGGRDAFQLPLRLLDAAIRYRETEDQRVLLALPVEERRILEEVLGLEEKVED